MNETLEYLQTFARFPFALRRFLKHRLTLDQAKEIVHKRMEHREDNFLRNVEKGVYGYPRSPYLPLLKMAGCELGDLRALVKQKGLEGALRELRRADVYVTYEELKGRKPIVRGTLTLKVSARDFDNPCARHDFTVQSGGSTGLATLVGQDLDHIAAMAANDLVMLSAHNLIGVPETSWSHIMPGNAFHAILTRTALRRSSERWFSPVGWRDSRYWLKYGLATWYMILCLRWNGIPVPTPEIVRFEQAEIIARWIHSTLQTRGRCILRGGVSRPVRVCIAAERAGLDLTGAVMIGGGEPVTPAKVALIERVGARLVSGYGMTEADAIGRACAQPSDIDDLHLFKDVHVLITHPHTVEPFGLTLPAFNLTSLLDTAPKLLLNAQVDDYGIVEERACGCELETYGYTTHLRQIRSYSKLVGEGVTLIGNEMGRIIEEILPARFGGSPLDYQLVEQEDDSGLTRLYLFVSPRVEITDENRVIEVILDALRDSSPMADVARTFWQNAGSIRVKRQEPISTARGKTLPLHILRRLPRP